MLKYLIGKEGKRAFYMWSIFGVSSGYLRDKCWERKSAEDKQYKLTFFIKKTT